MKVTVPFEVLWGDADPSGWIYYAAALRYVAEAEAKLFRKIGLLTNQMIEIGYANPRVHLSIDYIKPFKVHDQGLIHAWIDKVGSSSVSMAFELTDPDNKEVFIKGTLVTVIISFESEKPIPVPEWIKNSILERK
jgi:YbgC/YbaW family acyl-CoA thioester hydrolase